MRREHPRYRLGCLVDPWLATERQLDELRRDHDEAMRIEDLEFRIEKAKSIAQRAEAIRDNLLRLSGDPDANEVGVPQQA